MTITELIKFDKLKEENETLKKQLAEKDKRIKNLEEKWEILVCNNYELQQQQLYKEDFIIVPDLNNRYRGYISKEKYDKLPSKDVK